MKPNRTAFRPAHGRSRAAKATDRRGWIALFCVCIGILAFWWTTAAQASDGFVPWRFQLVKGDVTIEVDGERTSVRALPYSIPPTAVISTGAFASAVLVRGKDKMTIQPNSRVRMSDEQGSSMTSIFQELGDILFKVGKQPQPHFEVDTPYLAAVVKGTTFAVHVDDESARVFVREGAVEVATKSRETVMLTRPSQTARVLASAPKQIQVLKGEQVVRTLVGGEMAAGGIFNLRSGVDTDESSTINATGPHGANYGTGIDAQRASLTNGDAKLRSSTSFSDTVQNGGGASGSAPLGVGYADDATGTLSVERLLRPTDNLVGEVGSAIDRMTETRNRALPKIDQRKKGLHALLDQNPLLLPAILLVGWLIFWIAKNQIGMLRRVKGNKG